ncbi:nuclear transport factor 2 family protein [Mucilaginibacter calamicampi]|uniref:Nuclear transport factor 2 family protein n=1 Tax=Mucilaginibacter calamicampi TaxID=1302352 RepID=A0ABW2YUD9_9SPHI
MELSPNKDIIAGFYRQVVRERKSELIPNYVHQDYIQHSAMGRDGREALFEMVDFLKTLPPPTDSDKSPIMHLIEEGDLVVAHLDLHFMGKYIRVIELFRVRDGKAAEHWDVTEERTSDTESFIKAQLNISIGDKQTFLATLYNGVDIVIHRIISEGNFTAIHAEAKEDNRSIALFDIFQFEDNRLIGHWGAKQAVPAKMMHDNGMF